MADNEELVVIASPEATPEIVPAPVEPPAPEVIPVETVPVEEPVVDAVPSTPVSPVACGVEGGRFASFNNLYAQYAGTNGQIPVVNFKENCSLSALVSRIGSASSVSENTTIQETIVDNELTSPALAEMDSVADTFADQINQSVAALQTMKASIESLRQQIDTMTNNTLALDPLCSARLGKTETSVEVQQIPWNNILVLGTEGMITEYIHQYCDIRSNTITSNQMEIIARKVSVALGSTTSDEAFRDTNLSSEKYSEMVKVLATALPKYNEAQISDAVSILTSATSAALWTRSVCNKAALRDRFTLAADDFLTNIPVVSAVIDALNKNIVQLGDDAVSILSDNMKKAAVVMHVMAYSVINTRHNLSKDALVLQNKKINPDNLQEFVAKGGNNLAIAQYLNVMYPQSDIIPTFGVECNAILSSMESIRVRLESEEENDLAKISIARKHALRNAFRHSVDMFIREYNTAHEGSLRGDFTQIIDMYASDMISLNLTTEDSLWACLMRIMNNGTFTQELWKNLGVAYIKAISDNVTVNEEDKMVINATVYAEIVTNFIMKKFVTDVTVVPATLTPVEAASEPVATGATI